MWNTPVGVRSLRGHEREVFLEGGNLYISIMLDMINDGLKIGGDDGRPNKDDRFDKLDWLQQIVSIGEVGRYLLDENEDLYAPPLSRWSDLTIFKVYDFMIHLDDIETYGEMVRKAGVECSIIPESKKMDRKEFKLVLNVLADRILTPEGVVKKGRAMEAYLNALFPSFTVDKYIDAITLFFPGDEEQMEYAISLLPKAIRNRWAVGYDGSEQQQKTKSLAWYPVERKGTLCLVNAE